MLQWGVWRSVRQAGTSLGAGGGSRCRRPGKTWVVAVAELIFDFVCLSSQEREAATCSMKLAKLMSRSDKPAHSWVLKVM